MRKLRRLIDLKFMEVFISRKPSPTQDEGGKALFRLSELLKGARTGAPPHELFRSVDDEFWFWMNTEGLRRSERLNEILPGIPDETTQRNFTGATGDRTLREGFDFYTLVKRCAEDHGRSVATCENVLDFGCGWGRIIRFFLKDLNGSRLWGIDCYPTVLDIAKRANRWCKFELVDSLPPTLLAGGMFDLIYCFSVFSHLSEAAHERWLGEFERLLKPGGMLFATTRRRDFIEYCAQLRSEQSKQKIQEYMLGPAHAFLDTEKCLADYDSGKFCYSAVGGGGVLDKSFFGETAIPKAYVLKHWTKRFQFVDYISDCNICSQNVIIVKK